MGNCCVASDKKEDAVFSKNDQEQIGHKVSYPSQKIQKQESSQSTTSIKELHITNNDLIHAKPGVKVTDIYCMLTPPIGKGTFGECRKAIHKETGHVRAIKIMTRDASNVQDWKSLMNEVDIIKKLDHPNILKIYEYFWDQKRFYIVSELLTGGELFEKIIEQQYFNENQASEYMRQLISAIAHCHRNSIVHRDIKPENLLLESKKPNAGLKVIDFGTSRLLKPNTKIRAKAGTLFYMCPEIFKGNYDEKCDIWSCGVIMYVLLCGYPPFQGKDDDEIIENITKGTFPFIEQDWKDISSEAKDLILQMLKYDPVERISAEQALQHPWLKKFANQKVDTQSLKVALNNLKNYKITYKLQQLTWQLLASQFSNQEEQEDLIKTFKALDSNGDGVLSREELIKGYSRIFKSDNVAKDVDEILQNADVNHSGSLDYSEFLTVALNRQKLITNNQLIEGIFNMMDKDKSHSISAEELKEVFSTTGSQIDNKVWEEVIKEVDMNGDGEVIYYQIITSLFVIVECEDLIG